ncbi:hypothetical protein [Suttonella ornithocola]|uniref:Nucleotidyltransferase n=1 Tax=Suttonella ornithocola TaxID=279832 RepID=A0A380MTZ3_9GAMM|nr:hypothetical protein [Suttonella ornithocola]SUO95526.1 Uncharacterised protein [Suttonella ornithocola]
MDFCYVIIGAKTQPLLTWLHQCGIDSNQIGLSKIPHARELYALFYDKQNAYHYRGLLSTMDAQELRLSTIPKDEKPLALLVVNKDGYSSYCKEYASYQQWLRERNESRYQATQSHGQGYDAKNMMHTFRLLETALEIAETGKVQIRRQNREELLAIKQGKYRYGTLIQRAECLLEEIEQAFEKSCLPEKVNTDAALSALVNARKSLYSNGSLAK